MLLDASNTKRMRVTVAVVSDLRFCAWTVGTDHNKEEEETPDE